ncbi:MAG: hypothetical protein HOW73_00670 [Polyangiaceae bacterium]|nr:hypothetical protein [Polyangiaceae bacterium]
MISFRVDVDPREVVFIKSLVEASEGIASIFADHGGCLTFATPAARRSALVELLDDLVAHHGARVEALDSADDPIHGGGR